MPNELQTIANCATFYDYVPGSPADGDFWCDSGSIYIRTNGVTKNADDIGSGGGDTFTWDFSTTTTDADPGANTFRLNNATPASVTFIYIDDTPTSGIDVGSFLAELVADDHVYIEAPDGDAMLFKVSGTTTDGTGYWKIPVTHASGSTLFADTETCQFRFLSKAGGGTGDVVGPGSATDEAIARYDLTTGKLIQDSNVTINDAGTVIQTSGATLQVDANGGTAGTLDLAATTAQLTSPDTTDFVQVADGTLDLQTASTSRLDVTDSGVRMGAANARVTTILDEDTMATDSATALATQQSIKAYVDSKNPSDAFTWDFSTTITDADPGFNTFRLNNATPASVTFIYIDDQPTSAIDIGGMFAELGADDSVYIEDSAGSAMLFNLTGVAVDGTGYWKIPVAHQSGGSLFVNGETCTFRFIPAGAVRGPASSTDEAIALFDSTTGKLIQNSVVTVNSAAGVTTIQTTDAETRLRPNSGTGAYFKANATTGISLSPDGTDGFEVVNGTLSLITAGTTRLDATDSGVQLGAANARVTTILDEDTMATDSATALATQQSIKAYVDGKAHTDTFTWDFSTTTADADPGANTFRLDNATPASVTFIYADDLPTSGIDVGSFLAELVADDHVYIEAPDGDAMLFKVSGATTDGTGYWKIPVTHASGSTLFADTETCQFRFLSKAGGGTGDVVGPGSATDDAIARYDLTTGKLIQDSNVTINDAGTVIQTSGATLQVDANGGTAGTLDLAATTAQLTSPDTTDFVQVADGTLDLQTASTSRMDITDSGVRMGAANARVTTILDEDTMATDSATALATQQSIKAYVDTEVSANTDTFTWNFSTTTADADPGANTFRLNNATPASVTFIYIDDTPVSGIDVGSFLAELSADDHVYIEAADADAILFKVSGATTDGTGYWKIPVTHASGATLFADTEKCQFRFLSKAGGGGGAFTADGSYAAFQGAAVDAGAGANVGSLAQGSYVTASGNFGSFAQGSGGNGTGRRIIASGTGGCFAQGKLAGGSDNFGVLASGDRGSFAQGEITSASGINGSFAQGYQATASGDHGCFAQGSAATATENCGNFTQGKHVTTTGYNGCFAQGSVVLASGNTGNFSAGGCFAQGSSVTASGFYGSFVQGVSSTASGSYGSFAQGKSITASQHAGSFAQGILSKALITAAVDATGNTGNTGPDTVSLTAHGFFTGEAVVFAATGGGVTAGFVYYLDRIDANTFSVHTTFANAVAGTSHVAITGNLASDDIFRVGGTFAEGASVTASEVASFAQGVGATASGRDGSFSQGVNVTASGRYGSFSQGLDATASGYHGSFAQGSTVIASGSVGSFAQGRDSTASNLGTFAQGEYATASGSLGTFAQGSFVTASGSDGSFAQGDRATAAGQHGSFSQGSSVVATGGEGNFAQGYFATADGVYGTFAQGMNASSLGNRGLFAQGLFVTASGVAGNFAQGSSAYASGDHGCFAQGQYVIASQHAGSFAHGRNCHALVTTAVDATGNTGNTGPDTVTLATHGFNTGEAVIFAATGGGVTAGVVYYLDAIDANTFSVHTTFAAAVGAGAHVTITGNLASDDIFRVGGTFAEGASVTASEVATFAQGVGVTASGRDGSFAQGVDVTASGTEGSFAQGYQSTVTGDKGCFAQGNNITASGDYGVFVQGQNIPTSAGDNKGIFAQGVNITPTGPTGIFCQGSNVTSGGSYGTFAQGLNVTAGREGTFAQGNNAIGDGYKGCFAQGNTVDASGHAGCFAQGSNITATGDFGAFAQGGAAADAVIASGDHGCFAQGASATASGSLGSFAQGSNVTASGHGAWALGENTVADKQGQIAKASGQFAANGDAQISYMVARRQTTSASPLNLTLNGQTDAAGNRITVPANTSWAFELRIIARNTAAVENAVFHILGGITNDAGTTTLIGSVEETKITSGGGSSAWSIAVTADDTNDALQIEATGEAAHTINWVTEIRLTEVAG